jgi:putative hydrolase of the HAD superfamily
MKGVDVVLFDLDGTLFNDRGAMEQYLGVIFESWRSELKDDEAGFRRKWLNAIDRHYNRFLAGELSIVEQRRERIREVLGNPGMSAEAADVRMAEVLEAYEAAWRLFDDVIPALDSLSDRRLGIITNGGEAQQTEKLKRLGILDRFAAVITSETVGVAKPDEKIFAVAADQFGVPVNACVMVGDDWVCDVEGGRRAGMAAVWLDRQGQGRMPEDHRIVRISSLIELPGRLGRFDGGRE